MKYLILFLLLGIFAFGQEKITVEESENFTVELPESLNELLESKKQPADPPPPPPKVVPEYCQGASIQVFYSKDRQEAENKRKDFNAKFPSFKSRLEYVSPEFKIKVGIYSSRDQATADLNKVKKSFPLSLITTEKFRCSLLPN